MRVSIITISLILIFNCCNNNNQQREGSIIQNDNLSSSTDTGVDNSSKRLQIIREIIDSVGFVELPYTLNYNKGETHSIIEMNRGPIAKELGTYILYGTLPDTNQFYGFITCLPIDYCLTELVIFDKEGKLIDKKELLENNSHHEIGEDIYCNEYLTINNDLTINYYYNSKYVTDLIEIDTICEHYEKEGLISEKGIISFEKRKEFKCK